MFDRCILWRSRLSRLADGTLPTEQRPALEAHLARCPRCRAAREADLMLSDALDLRAGLLSAGDAAAFDARVLAALRQSPQPARRPAFALDPPRARFTMNLLAGASLAACVTIACLTMGLRAGSRVPAMGGGPSAALLPEPDRSAPLESLLEVPAPRAASLWAPRIRGANSAHGLRPTPDETPLLHAPHRTRNGQERFRIRG